MFSTTSPQGNIEILGKTKRHFTLTATERKTRKAFSVEAFEAVKILQQVVSSLSLPDYNTTYSYTTGVKQRGVTGRQFAIQRFLSTFRRIQDL